jgi:hypothetical protein
LRPATASLDTSGTTEPDGHSTVLDDHGNLPTAIRERQHTLQAGSVLLDVDIANGNVPLFVVLTGGCRVGSSVLAEDEDLVGHWSNGSRF